MNKKIILSVTIFIMLISLWGCASDKAGKAQTKASADNVVLSTEKVGETELTSEKKPEEAEISTSQPETEATQVPDNADDGNSDIEQLQELSDEPAYGFVWALDEAALDNAERNPETIEYITYDGTPIAVYCQLSSASLKPWEFGLFIEVDGVLQELTVDGEKTEIYRFELQSFETKTVKMTFEPNIGKKDEIKNLSCAISLSPDYIADESGGYRLYHEPSASGNFPLFMKTDSKGSADVITADTSLYKVSEIDKRIYRLYEQSNNLEYFESSPCCYVYENLKDYLKGDGVRNTRITAKASQNSRLTVNLHGKPGTYRISFYLNGKRLYSFDGKEYIDVTIGKNQQAEIPVIIDTSDLRGATRIEVYFKEIDCNFVDGDVIASSGAQKYIIK